MPLDGIVVKNLVYELNKNAALGKIDKIYQPAKEEIIISVRAFGNNLKILVSSGADCPKIHFTNKKYENPQTPPAFCMSLRKHLQGGKICEFFQPSLERIIEMKVESRDELGDLSEKRLILEIMGKHSNIILVNESGKILDCAKKISFEKSSVREVLPGKQYVYPPAQNKLNPLSADSNTFVNTIKNAAGQTITDAIYKSFCGISPLAAVEICCRAGICHSDFVESIDDAKLAAVSDSFIRLMSDCKNNEFYPEIVMDKNRSNKPLDFSSIKLHQFSSMKKVEYAAISSLLEYYYEEKAGVVSIKQKTVDLRKIVENNIKRCVKKTDVLNKTLKDTESMDKWRLYGELITSYISFVKHGDTYIDAQNYYDDNIIVRIKLDETLTPAQNATRYFDKYNKAKRQKKAVLEQLSQNEEELLYFEGLSSILQNEITESEISEIREELHSLGYLKKNPVKKGMKLKKSEPLHFVSSDGFNIYVGKNNRQNDELTLKTASSNDIWLHTKDIPGSHVIIKTNGNKAGDTAIIEAAMIAAYYSKAKDGSNVPVDYTLKKHVKKPNGAKPGMVIYDNHKTAYVTPKPDTQ